MRTLTTKSVWAMEWLNVRAKEFLCKHTNVTTCSLFRTRTLTVW